MGAILEMDADGDGDVDVDEFGRGLKALQLQLSEAEVKQVFAALDASGDLDRVMVVTTSEFGRRVAENGSLGTDHGNGGLQFAFGPSVAGGVVHGGYDLGSLDDGDVPLAVDTRSVYRSALEWLGGAGAADGVFDDDPEALSLLSA